MRFASIGHLRYKGEIKHIPSDWVRKGDVLISPEVDICGTKGHFTGITLTAEEMMSYPVDQVRGMILDAAMMLEEEYRVDVVQLGALTTSVTSGGVWFADQQGFHGSVTHGDSYTAAVTCQAVRKVLHHEGKEMEDLVVSIVGAYGVIGEAVSKVLVSEFKHAVLIGPRRDRLLELSEQLDGDFELSTELETSGADVVVTATNHPDALLEGRHLKRNVIVVDVAQPVNVSLEVCKKRPDMIRVDGGMVDFPGTSKSMLPDVPDGKIFACIAEVIMQAMECERENHVGSIDRSHLLRTERWAEKYGFLLSGMTNFGVPVL